MVLLKVVIDTSSHDEVLAMRNDEFKRRLRQMIRKELARTDLRAIVREQIAHIQAVQTVDAMLLKFHKPPLEVEMKVKK